MHKTGARHQEKEHKPPHQMTKVHGHWCPFQSAHDKRETLHLYPSTFQKAWVMHFLHIHQYQVQKVVDH